jgi:O-antigen/teichoic acid export membrane protein
MTLDALRRRASFLVQSGYATATAGSAGLLLLLLMAAGRFLSVADYGRFSYALALTTMVETLMDIGLGPVTMRAVARDKTKAAWVFSHVLGIKLVWVAGGLLVIAVITPLLRSDPLVIQVCYLMGVSSAIRSYLLSVRGLLQGLERFDLEAATVVADRVLLLIAGGLTLWAGQGLRGLAFAFVGSRLLMLVVTASWLRRVVATIRPRFDWAVWRTLQASALPLGFFMVTLNMYTYVDTVILGVMRSDAETGLYAASYRVYEGLTYVPSILATVLTPRLSHLFEHDRAAHRHLFRRVLAVAVALGVVLGGLTIGGARSILVLLFGPDYLPAVAPLQILAGGAVFAFSTWILHAAAISPTLDRRLLVTTSIGLVTNVALNILFIPKGGIAGAAWATVIAEALTVVLLFRQVHRRMAEPC